MTAPLPGVTMHAAAVSLVALLVGCDGLSKAPPTFAVTGTVTGLSGEGLILRGGEDTLAVPADGPFSFLDLPDGAAFDVTIDRHPERQLCAVTGGSGRIDGADATGVAVTCTTDTYRVGARVTGLGTDGVVLRNNGGDELTVLVDGEVSFATRVPDGSGYDVTVHRQPSDGIQCVARAPSGPIAGADVTVTVACSRDHFVGGVVDGLEGGGLVLMDGTELLPISADGAFTFTGARPVGDPYHVAVVAQPSGPDQVCVASDATGQVTADSATAVRIQCATTSYPVSGVVQGLVGTVILGLGGTTDTVTADGPFTLGPIDDGTAFTVAPESQPLPLLCAPVQGTVAGGPVTGLVVHCACPDGSAASAWYPDGDGDLYGDSDAAPELCARPGLVALAGDCDDADPGRHPNRTEVIDDGIDQDCDHQELCYLGDYDYDGWVSGTPVPSHDLACDDSGEAGGGSAVGDCDDADPSVFPGAAELCDGQQNDCDTPWTLADEDGVVTHFPVAGDPAALTLSGTTIAPTAGTLQVCPGTYTVNLYMPDGSLTLRSRDGDAAAAAVTILDGNQAGPVIQVEDGTPLIHGLTLTGGSGVEVVFNPGPTGPQLLFEGGGLYVMGGEVTLLDSVITGNSADYGAGISLQFLTGASLYAEGVEIVDNHGRPGNEGWGGGILVGTWASVHVVASRFANNDFYAIHVMSEAEAVVSGTTFEGNTPYNCGGNGTCTITP